MFLTSGCWFYYWLNHYIVFNFEKIYFLNMKKTYLIAVIFFGILSRNYAQVNLNFGLIAQYYFTDESLDDTGPNVLNLINNNGATPASDRFGIPSNAYLFDGIDDYLSTSNNSVLTLGYGATISMWVNLNDVTSNQKLIGKLTTPPISTDGGYLIGVENGQFKIETWVVGSVPYSLTAGNIAVNQWTHVAVTFQSTNYLTLYLNGQAIDSVMVSDALEANSNDLIIGAAPWDQAYFHTDGTIDDIRIYNREINTAEMNALYSEVVTGNGLLENNNCSYFNNNGVYTINTSDKHKISSIQLSDASGKVLEFQKLNHVQSQQLDLTQFAKGIYFAQLITDKGLITLKLTN